MFCVVESGHAVRDKPFYNLLVSQFGSPSHFADPVIGSLVPHRSGFRVSRLSLLSSLQLVSLFMAVNIRSAGQTCVPVETLSAPSVALTLMFMYLRYPMFKV